MPNFTLIRIKRSGSRTVGWLLLLTLLLPLARPAGAQAPALVQSNPASVAIAPGQAISLQIELNNAQDVYGIDVQATFDPQLVEVVDTDPQRDGVQLAPGRFPQPDFIARNSADNVAGTLQYAITQVNPTEAVSGSGIIFTVTLRARGGAGQAMLTIHTVELTDRDGIVQPVQAANGVIQIARGNAGVSLGNLPTATPPTAATLPATASVTTVSPAPTAAPTTLAPQTTVAATATTVPALANPAPTAAVGVPTATRMAVDPTTAPSLAQPTVTQVAAAQALPTASAPMQATDAAAELGATAAAETNAAEANANGMAEAEAGAGEAPAAGIEIAGETSVAAIAAQPTIATADSNRAPVVIGEGVGVEDGIPSQPNASARQQPTTPPILWLLMLAALLLLLSSGVLIARLRRR